MSKSSSMLQKETFHYSTFQTRTFRYSTFQNWTFPYTTFRSSKIELSVAGCFVIRQSRRPPGSWASPCSPSYRGSSPWPSPRKLQTVSDPEKNNNFSFSIVSDYRLSVSVISFDFGLSIDFRTNETFNLPMARQYNDSNIKFSFRLN